jgi:hypothetical protein
MAGKKDFIHIINILMSKYGWDGVPMIAKHLQRKKNER